ncbi:MAG: hypothetical protein WC889_02810 [Myxococcota bacterium]|jgi:hypothetical protein
MTYLPLSAPANLIAWARTLVTNLTQRDAQVTDTNLFALPEYADDAAAAAGGVRAGQLYRTATGEVRAKL